MDRHIIREVLPEIPVSEADLPHSASDIWTVIDGDALFTMARHVLRLSDGHFDYFKLDICGVTSERARLYEEFRQCLGDPSKADISDEQEYTDKITWFIRSSLLS